MKTNILIIYNYGYRDLTFKKTFDLPFTPFLGMIIIDEEEDRDITLEFNNDEYYSTIIYYYPKSNSFDVERHRNWCKYKPSVEIVEDILDNFKKLGWILESSEEQVNEMMNWIKSENLNK